MYAASTFGYILSLRVVDYIYDFKWHGTIEGRDVSSAFRCRLSMCVRVESQWSSGYHACL